MTKFFEDEAKMIAEDLFDTCESYNEALALVEQNVNEMWAQANWGEADKAAYIATTGIEPERVGMTVEGVAKMFLGMETINELKTLFA